LTVSGNIVRHNSGFGLHLYPSIRRSVISLNLVYGHWYCSGIIVACPEGGGQNLIVNNTAVDNAVGLDIRRLLPSWERSAFRPFGNMSQEYTWMEPYRLDTSESIK